MGLGAEARLARGLGAVVAIGGGDAAGAEMAAARLAATGVRALLSFGLAGGLSPDVQAGRVIIPDGVVCETGERWQVDAELAARLGTPGGLVLAAPQIIATRAAKRAAWMQSGAVAADLESGAVARAAKAHGIPFAVLRAVCDPAGRDLPPAALTALDGQGRIQTGALLRSLARYPAQIPALIALGREAAQARRSLLEQVAAIGPLD